MTFFANSGIRFPRIREQTRIAGEMALRASAQIWHTLSAVEGREVGHVDDRPKNEAAIMLKHAAEMYHDMLDGIDDPFFQPFTPAELDLAALSTSLFRTGSQVSIAGLISAERINVKLLYQDLIIRLNILASELIGFDPNRPKEDLAPQAFRIMQQWETIAMLGRVISTLNRRRSPNPG